MASNEEQDNKSINGIRTNLLLMANEELSSLKKNTKTKINSKKITEAEDYYSNSANNYIVKLQEEKFIPSSITRNVIQNVNFKRRISFTTPDIHKLYNSNFIVLGDKAVENKTSKDIIDYNNNNHENNQLKFGYNNSNHELEFDLLWKKSTVSYKKNLHFKKKSLKLTDEELKKHINSKIDSCCLFDMFFFGFFIFCFY